MNRPLVTQHYCYTYHTVIFDYALQAFIFIVFITSIPCIANMSLYSSISHMAFGNKELNQIEQNFICHFIHVGYPLDMQE